MHQSIRSPRPPSVSITLAVPSTAGPSSSLVNRNARLPLKPGFAARKVSAATIIAAMPPFMSAAPRP
jgi:hypothetical protein